LTAHRLLMQGLIDSAGRYRSGGVGVMAGSKVLHMAPPARRVPRLMDDLFSWLATTADHPLIVSSVFHYEFGFIHPFADGNGRIGRLWQTLLLSHWQKVFAYIPVESMVHRHQSGYYQALNQSTAQTDSAAFIGFMLQRIKEALADTAESPHDAPQVTPQVVKLLQILIGSMSREQLQQQLGLADRKSFRQAYLQPALEQGLIEMTLPDKPQSKLQQYRITPAGKAVLQRIKQQE
jgi:Fic family protein